ncbi:MAG TPA: TrmH family RNA methyltransferase [Gemmatimonadota bacterium]|nr:TrmH family RNA methyltransferase [Gemmatimonadota bacterium]
MADEPTPDPGSAERFRSARRDPGLVVLEGFHPLKHALRFGASVLEAVTEDADRVLTLAADLAPDLTGRLRDLLVEVPPGAFRTLVPSPPSTGVVARARRPPADTGTVLGADPEAPIVLLERPSRLGNLGAAVRVAAAAGAAGVLTVGESDPWHPDAIRGAAGLQFALPVARTDELPPPDAFAARRLVAIDPGGEPLEPEMIPVRAVLAFGSERSGLSEALLRRADDRLALPMRPGVSSLNLAAAVAAVLYAWRLGRP